MGGAVGKMSGAAGSESRDKSYWPLFTVIVLVSLFVCFWNLGAASISNNDEKIHVRVVQAMYHDGISLLPMLDGLPYLSKPLLKMWLSLIPLSVLGESNFSYRFIDALAGLGTVLLCFFIGRMMLRSTFGGFLAAFLLLTSHHYIFVHVVRSAVQDSFLVFASTLSIYALLRFCQVLSTNPEKKLAAYSWAALFGFSVAAGVLTKSAAGLLPIGVTFVFLLLRPGAMALLSQNWSALLLGLSCAVVPPSIYYGILLFFWPDSWSVFWDLEVAKRISEGYHNKTKIWFYFTLLIGGRAGPSACLFLPGLCLAIYDAFKKRSESALLLCVWAILPVLVYSCVPSRLSWYIAPLYPAIAILASVFCLRVLESFARTWRAKERPGMGRLLKGSVLGILSLCILSVFSCQAYFVVRGVLRQHKAIGLDQLARAIKNDVVDASKPFAYTYGAPAFSMRERFYVSLLNAQELKQEDSELRERFNKREPFIILLPFSRVQEISSFAPASGYFILAPDHERKENLIALAFNMKAAAGFNAWKRQVDLGANNLKVLYNIGKASRLGDISFRTAKAPSAAFTVSGDSFTKLVDQRVSINFAFVPKAAGRVEGLRVFLNHELVGFLPVKVEAFRDWSFIARKDLWRVGENVFSFVFDGDQKLAYGADLLFLNWISIEPAG